ncbi:MAG: diaminopimelate epimerase, partial [Dissulfurispiraceae bacterium]
FKITCVSMGNPHAVIFIDEEVDCFPVSVYGPAIESHPFFPNKTNVEFVNVLNKKELKMRVWERGTGETMACGTGASASAVAGMLKELTERNVAIHLPGGVLNIKWPRNDHVYMTGPAVEVFEGKIANISEKKAEQRRHQRKACEIQLEFFRKAESRDKLYQCTVVDISEAGAGMTSDINLKPGEILSLFKKDSQTVLKSAVVIWNSKYKDKCRVGVMFM